MAATVQQLFNIRNKNIRWIQTNKQTNCWDNSQWLASVAKWFESQSNCNHTVGTAIVRKPINSLIYEMLKQNKLINAWMK